MEIQAPDIGERYRDYTLIGAGGVSVVFRAHDGVLEKPVTVKVLKIKDFSNQTAMRFQQEAKAANRLHHLNIVKVLDFGVTAGNQLYMVMDYIDGRDLQKLINETGGLSKPKALYIARQIAGAMAHAHKQGVIHRDLKPSNVMLLNPEDDEPEVRVVDFGLAKVQSEEHSDARLTRTGLAVGSPFYMSPEQIRGHEVDARSDIYSLGCVMFEMLSGKPPFVAETPLKTFEAHLRKAPPDLRDTAPEANLALADLIDKMLAKAPDDRFQSMEQLLDELISREDALLAMPAENEPALESARSRIPVAFLITIIVAIGLTACLATQLVGQKLAGSTPVRWQPGEGSPVLDNNQYTNKFSSGERHHKIYWGTIDGAKNDEDLRELKDNANIENLDLVNSTIKGPGLRYINPARLRYLDLTHSTVDDKNLHYINRFDNLEELILAATNISNDGLKTLGPLPKLEYLNLAGCRSLDNQSVEIISTRLPHLRQLNLSDTAVRLKDLTPLNKMKGFYKLLYRNNNVTDSDLQDLLAVKNIEKLYLNGNPQLTDASFKIFSQMDGLSKVELIDCPGITRQGVNAYKSRFSDRHVDWDTPDRRTRRHFQDTAETDLRADEK